MKSIKFQVSCFATFVVPKIDAISKKKMLHKSHIQGHAEILKGDPRFRESEGSKSCSERFLYKRLARAIIISRAETSNDDAIEFCHAFPQNVTFKVNTCIGSSKGSEHITFSKFKKKCY